MVDAADLKSADLAVVGVQVSPWAPPHVVLTGAVVLADGGRVGCQRGASRVSWPARAGKRMFFVVRWSPHCLGYGSHS